MNPSPTNWLPPPADLTLPDAVVHVWRATLDWPETYYHHWRSLLTPDERERADRFRLERDRRHFSAGRGILRSLLARYLSVSPAAIRFQYGEQGKPALAAPVAPHGIQFNLSHAGGVALYAVARRAVGVDIEIIKPAIDFLAVAERFFSPQETAVLHTLPAAQQPRAFFDGWVRKEAIIKAAGEGLSLPLDSFAVSLRPDEPAALLWHAPAVNPDWSIIALPPGPGYTAALAAAGDDWRCQTWQWSAP